MLEMLMQLRDVAQSYEGKPERQVEIYLDAAKEFPVMLKLMCETFADAEVAIRKISEPSVRYHFEKRLQSLKIKAGYDADVNGLEG